MPPDAEEETAEPADEDSDASDQLAEERRILEERRQQLAEDVRRAKSAKADGSSTVGDDESAAAESGSVQEGVAAGAPSGTSEWGSWSTRLGIAEEGTENEEGQPEWKGPPKGPASSAPEDEDGERDGEDEDGEAEEEETEEIRGHKPKSSPDQETDSDTSDADKRRLRELLVVQPELPRSFKYPGSHYNTRFRVGLAAMWPIAAVLLYLRVTDLISLVVILPTFLLVGVLGFAAYHYGWKPAFTVHEVTLGGVRVQVGSFIDQAFAFSDIERIDISGTVNRKPGVYEAEGDLVALTEVRDPIEIVLAPDHGLSWNGKPVDRILINVVETAAFIDTAKKALELAHLRKRTEQAVTAGKKGSRSPASDKRGKALRG